MTTGTNFLAGQASLWVQPDGPNTEPKYLGCHSIGDITEPKGDSTLLYCPDPAQTGKFVVKNSFKGEPGAITTSIETDVRPTADYLEDLAVNGCPFPIFVHKLSTGRRDVFTNFERSFVLRGVDVTSTTLARLSSRTPSDEGESTQSFDLSVQEVLRCFNMQISRLSLLETEDVTAITVLGQNRCEGSGQRKMRPEDSIFASTKHLTGSAANAANVLNSSYGAGFVATGANPFGAGYDISGCVGFLIGATTVRVIVSRGTTVGGSPAAIAYSDDDGDTWTTVSVGSVNGEFMSSPNALFALDRYHIWFGTNLGRIYFSEDGGLTWTIHENAVISASAITGISFSDEENGVAVWTGTQSAVCVDGFSWSVTGLTGLTGHTDCYAVTEFELWATAANGVAVSMDRGDTWVIRSSVPTAAIDFLNEMFGMFVGSGANANVYMTIDGGYDWLVADAIANSGYTNVEIVSTKLAYITGNANGGTGLIAKVIPV